MLNPFRTVTKEGYYLQIYHQLSQSWRVLEVEDITAPVDGLKRHEIIIGIQKTKVIKKWWEIWK